MGVAAWYLGSLSSFLMWVCLNCCCYRVSAVPGDSWLQKSKVDGVREFLYFR